MVYIRKDSPVGRIKLKLFYIYRSNQNDPHQVIANNNKSIESAPWVDDAPIKILIHGYTGYKDFSPNTEIRPGKLHLRSQNLNKTASKYVTKNINR